MTEKKKYISVSQLEMYERCGVQYWFRYVKPDAKPAPPGIALLKGSGVHAGARENFRKKRDTHEDLPATDIIDISVAAFEMEFAKAGEILPTEDDLEIGVRNALGKAKDSVVTLAGLFAIRVAPKYQPVYVEADQRIVVPDSEYDLRAIMDLADSQDVVTDLKTATKSKTQKDVDLSQQLTFYSMVFKLLTGRMPKEVRLETLVDKKEPTAQLLSSTRSIEDFKVLLRRISRMIEGIQKKDFQPTLPTNWWCSQWHCGWWPDCEFAVRK